MPVVPEHVLLDQHEADPGKSGEEAEQFVPTPIVAGRMLARNMPDDFRVDEVRHGNSRERKAAVQEPPQPWSRLLADMWKASVVAWDMMM